MLFWQDAIYFRMTSYFSTNGIENSHLNILKCILTALIFDENEIFNLKRVCDEIFGADNYIESLVWKKRYGAGGGTKGFAKLHEYLLVYSKKTLSNIEAKLSSDQIDSYSKKDEKYETRGGYITQPLATSSKGERANLMYGFDHKG